MSAMRFWRDADSCRVSRRPAFCKRRWMGCRAWRPSRLVTATARWQRAVARPSIASIGPNPARPQAVETAATLAGGLSLGGHGRHGQAPVQSSRLGRLGRLGQLGQWSHLGQLSRCGRHGHSGGCRGKRQRRGWRGCWHWRSHGDSAGRCLLLDDNRLLMRDFGKCWERANINQEIAVNGRGWICVALVVFASWRPARRCWARCCLPFLTRCNCGCNNRVAQRCRTSFI